MPSTIIGNPLASGPQIIVSGNPWSGLQVMPQGGIQLKLGSGAAGNVYIGLSGGTTLNSGGLFLSGASGLLDGMPVGPGESYFIPRYAFKTSGTYTVYARHDAAASGIARLYYEIL